MVDIHSYILPGLDDGVESMEEAIMMALQACIIWRRPVTGIIMTIQ